jgi:hypothetical protein
MKALTVKQPWAHLICTGFKDVENRTWRTNFRGRVLIHAGLDRKLKPDYTREQLNALYPYFTGIGTQAKKYGVIIGSVEIVDCVINHPSIWAEKFICTDKCPECGCSEYHYEDIIATGYRVCRNCDQEWYTDVNYGKPIYNWVLSNPILFDEPILNVRGKLSFWDCSEHFLSRNNK